MNIAAPAAKPDATATVTPHLRIARRSPSPDETRPVQNTG